MARPDRTALIATSVLAVAAVSCDLLSRVADQATAAQAHAALLQQEQLARSEGIPLTFADLVKPVPPAEDAEPLYLAASKQFQALHTNPYPVLLNPEKTDEVRRLLAKAAPGLALLDKAVALPDCQIIKSPTSGLDLPEFARLKFMARIAVSQAELRARDGHPVEALADLARREAVCRHLEQSPCVIANLEDISSKALFQSSIARILNAYGRQAGVPEAAWRALDVLNSREDLARVEEGENLARLELLSPAYLAPKPGEHGLSHSLAPGDALEGDEAVANRLAMRPGMADRWRALEVEVTRETLAALREASVRPLELERRLQTISNAAAMDKHDSHAFVRIGGPMNVIGDNLDFDVRCESMNRVLYGSCATFEAWNKSGKLPTSLPDNGPLALDPFTGKSLHYSTSTTGFKIYGVGSHGVDHGGLPRAAVNSALKCDEVFEYHPISSTTAGHTAFNSEFEPTGP